MTTHLQNVTALSHGPLAAADPCVSVYGSQQHFGYRDSTGIVWDSWYDGNGHWNLQQINGASGRTPKAPLAIAGPFVGVFHDQQHFAYVDKDGVIWDSWYDGSGRWNLQFINSKFVGEPGIGPPAFIYDWLSVSLWNDSSNTQQHFTYLGQDSAIHDTYYDSDPPLAPPYWKHQTFDSGGGKASSSPFACVFHQQQHIGFLADFGDLLDRWYDGSGHWDLQAIAGSRQPRRTNGPEALLGIPPYVWVDYTNSQQHFTYLGADRAICDAFWDSGQQSWNFQKLTLGGATDGPEAWSRPTVCNFQPAGFINRVYIAYRDVVGLVWIVTYANSQWFLVKLKGLPFGASTDFQGDVPSASGNIAGWVNASRTQVHFTFRHIEHPVIVHSIPLVLVEDRGVSPAPVRPDVSSSDVMAPNLARRDGVIWDLFYDQPPHRG